jgi:hypothetical protein
LSRTIVVRDQDDERTYEAPDLPLAVGGTDAHIPVPGVSGAEPLAFLGLSDDQPFVQPGSRAVPVFCNERLIETSRWLSHGDAVRVDDVRIQCEFAGDRLEFRVGRVPRSEAVESAAAPLLESEEIEPVAYPGAAEVRTGGTRRLRPIPVLISAFFLRSL